MSTATQIQDVSVVEGDRRVGDYDWPLIAQHLDAHGWALLPKLLTASECATIAGLYTDDRLFRSHIVMARHGFGRGEYKYFTYPLPDKVTALRTALYAHLAPIANRWSASLGLHERYPDGHSDFITRCHNAGPRNPGCLPREPSTRRQPSAVWSPSHTRCDLSRREVAIDPSRSSRRASAGEQQLCRHLGFIVEVGGPEHRQLEPIDQLAAQRRGASKCRLVRIQPGEPLHACEIPGQG